nr:hypothetical protein [Tanacetum cinerariifolium]
MDVLDNATYLASADDIAVQSYFFDIHLTNLSPRNCIPSEVLLRISIHLAWSASEKVVSSKVAFGRICDAFFTYLIYIVKLIHSRNSSDEELEAPMEDQPLPADASPTAILPGYVADSNPEEDEEDLEEDPTDYLADGGDNDDNESSDDDNDDDDVEKMRRTRMKRST